MIARPDSSKMIERFDNASLAAMSNMIEANEYHAAITNEIAILGPGIMRALDAAGVKIRSVGAKNRINDMSAVIKRFGITVQPGVQGLYIPFDKALYIVVAAPGVIIHELGHAWDHVMSPDSIPVGFDPLTASMADCARVKPFKTQNDKAFLNSMIGNTQSVSRYGTTNPQEFWAESVRAFTNVNDTGNLYDEISAPKYRTINRSSYAFMQELFLHFNGRSFEKWRHSDTSTS